MGRLAVSGTTRAAQHGPSSGEARKAASRQRGAPRRAGSGAVGVLQSKLRVNELDDRYEREADRVADRVLAMSPPQSQPQARDGGPARERDEREQTRVQRQAVDEEEPEEAQASSLQRRTDEDEERMQQWAKRPRRPRITPRFEAGLTLLHHVDGQPLPESLRAFLEPRFGASLAGVRAHVGPEAAELARDANARAFTVGRHIVFGAGEYRPGLEQGRRLIAHELTHVFQQRGGLHSVQREVGPDRPATADPQADVDLLPQQSARTIGLAPLQHEKGTTTQVELDDFYVGILEHWEQQSQTLPVGPERAEARRVWLLLSFRPNFASYDDINAFLTTCLEIAKDETRTVENLKKDPSVELDFFVDNGDAFPNWWANRINDELYGSSNEGTLEARFQEARKQALINAALLSDEIWWSGLPLTKQQSAQLKRASIPELALSFENARKFPKERIGNYARLLVTWERTHSHWLLVQWFRSQLRVRLDQIRRGELVVDADTWQNVLATKFFNIKLRVFESAASTPDDMRAAFSALMLQRPGQFFRDSLGGGFKYKFPDEAVQMFWREIQEVDQRIAAASGVGRIWQSWEWAHARGYFSEAALEIYEAVKQDWPWMVARLVAVFIAQFVPGLNIAVDIALLVEFGFNGITAFLDLVDTFESAYDATTVDGLQRAAAKMAGSMVGLGAKVVMWALTAGVRWSAKQIKKYHDAKKFLDEHGDTPETREALAKAKGDATAARKHLAAKREQERLAREKAAAEAKHTEEKKQRDLAEAERQQREREQQERAQQAAEQEQQEVERLRAKRKADKDEQLRLKRESNPDWPVVGKKPVKPYIATPSRYLWKHSDGNFIDATFRDGTLSVTLKATGNPRARGTDLLDAVFKHFGPTRIKQFDGLWVRGTGYEYNLDAYLKNLGANHASAAARAAAARDTWTGREMAGRGLTKVTVPAHGANPSEVHPEFSK